MATYGEKLASQEFELKVWRHELVGVILDQHKAAENALRLIGQEWDKADFDGEGHDLSFMFELDNHRFTVNVTPV